MVAKAEAALMAVAFGRAKVALLIVAVPVAAPKAKVVAAPPTLTVVAFVLNRLPVVLVVVTEPPLAATFPAVVILPFDPVIEKLVAVTSLAPKDRALTIAASDRSIPLVIAPPPVEVTLIAAPKV